VHLNISSKDQLLRVCRQVHLELVESVLMHLLLNYESLGKVEPMPQVAALQAVFDVRFLISLFILRDSKVLKLKKVYYLCLTIIS